MKEQHCSELEAAFVVADLMEGKSVRGVYDRRLRVKKIHIVAIWSYS